MIVYRIKHNTLSGGSVIWDTPQDASDEVKMHLLEGSWGSKITVEIIKISEEDYNKLQEFEGY